jgi:tetratricopeptide (TPR) repeat protein
MNRMASWVALGTLSLVVSGEARAQAEKVPELFEISFGLEAMGNYRGALGATQRILKQDDKNYTAVLRLAWLQYKLGKYDESIAQYRRAVDLAPGSIEPKLGILLPYAAASSWPEVEKYAKEVLAAAPGDATATSRLAWAMYSQGRYAEALKLYKKVLDLYPTDQEMQLGMGWTLIKMGRGKEARGYFERVLVVRQYDARALEGLAAAKE